MTILTMQEYCHDRISGFRRALRSGVDRVLRPFGFELRRINPATMDAAVMRLPQRGFKVETIIDVGAAKGSWAELAAAAFPHAKVFMIEALREREGTLKSLCQARRGFSYHIGAAGSKPGAVSFLVTDDLDGSGVSPEVNQEDPRVRTVETDSLDNLADRHGLKPPFLLKLDTHGFEVPIIEGAERLLESTQVVIIECYSFQGKTCSRLLFWEMCEWMRKRGFRCFDLVDPILRPSDGVLWQVDLFFARSDWPSFSDLKWH
jgi:FkbM family methyltransferase